MRIAGVFCEQYEPEVVIVHEIDWLVLDFVLECYKRINRRLEEMGIDLSVPLEFDESLDAAPHYPRRPRHLLVP